MSKFSENVDKWFNETWPEIGIDNIDNLPLDKLRVLKDEVVAVRQQLKCTEDSIKQLGNAAYGACANPGFYFFNQSLAGDITGECRALTKFMVDKGEDFFHDEIWNRKDLWEKYDIDLDESKHNWLKDRPIWIYSDTDSIDKNSLLLTKENNQIKKLTIEELYKRYGDPKLIRDSKNFKISKDNILVANYIDNEIKFVPIKWIMGHRVNKPKWILKTKSGKEIKVTDDHSLIVFRDGQKISIKASEININTDKILSIIEE